MISRRQFLLASAAGIAGTVGIRFQLYKIEDAIADVILQRLSYLNLDESGVRKFAGDLASKNMLSGGKLRAMNAVGLIKVSFEEFGVYPQFLLNGEQRIVTAYLLSTDFFQTGADVSRVVNYLGFYDPLSGACINPFPRSIVEPESPVA